MTQDLVERLARALYEEEPHLNAGEPLEWEILTDQYKSRYRARVGIILLEIEASGTHRVAPVEATEEMKVAARYEDGSLDIWEAMIAAAPEVK